MNLKLITLISLLGLINVSLGAKTYEIGISDFTDLTVRDGISVSYTNSNGNQKARIIGDDDNVSKISVESRGDKLVVSLTDAGLSSSFIPRVEVTSTMLFKVQNNGDSTVTVRNTPKVPKFSGRLEGNGALIIEDLDATEVTIKKFTGKGDIKVTGVCETASIGNTGAGAVDCAGLKAVDAKCNVLGTGSIYVNASGILSVTGVNGTVFFTGYPTEMKSRALGVKLRPIEQQPAE